MVITSWRLLIHVSEQYMDQTSSLKRYMFVSHYEHQPVCCQEVGGLG